jgi:DNA-binding CsgD family transcriptional regulator
MSSTTRQALPTHYLKTGETAMSDVRMVIEDESVFAYESPHFPTKLFERLSREELFSLLRLMHRILNVEEQRDVDSLLIDLPRFVRDSLASPISPSSLDALIPVGHADKTASLVADYLLSRLVQAQARIEIRPAQYGTPYQLSSRELSVLRWMKEGKTNWEISRILGLSERTIRFHVGSIFEKLEVTSRTQAVARALGTGLIAS